MTCTDCKQVAYAIGGLAISPGGLNGSYELVKGPVCEVMPAELDCQKNLPWFWNVLGQWMFNPAEGWYAPKYFCSDVCPASDSENDISSEISCKDCSDRLYGNTAYMANKDVLTKAVADFKKAGFCELIVQDPKEVEDCNRALEIVIPVGMTTLASSGDKWIDDACKTYIDCKN